MSNNKTTKYEYDKAYLDREACVERIIKSGSRKKIIIAGPGTGKTFLFRKALENKRSSLVLTFINALVEDLSLELCGLSDVRTLHGFAFNILKEKDPEISIFPKLTEVIQKDARILLGEDIDFKRIFNNIDEANKYIDFYRKRKKYYGKYYGYSDIVFALFKYFKLCPKKIPKYDQILVDEFQDFSPLEVALIEQLSDKSPILIVGDDDQAIYEFKDADPKHIRLKHNNRDQNYESFNLPYCSRCTRVIVDTANDIINGACENGLLRERVSKPYIYFPDELKDKESDDNPTILYSRQYARRIPWFLESNIVKIAQELRHSFSVLIICPTRLQCKQVANSLIGKGFKNIEYKDASEKKETLILEGLKLLLLDNNRNLGWRIVSECLINDSEFIALLKKTNGDNPIAIRELLGRDYENEVKKSLRALKKCEKDGIIDESNVDILKRMGQNPCEIIKKVLIEELSVESSRVGNPGVRRLPIRISTIEGSKGLSGDYVFITYFDDQYFIKDSDKRNIADKDICNFVVALTRARKRVYLISSQDKHAAFFRWIKQERIETINSE